MNEIKVEDTVRPLAPHKYDNGKCVVCEASDPSITDPVIPGEGGSATPGEGNVSSLGSGSASAPKKGAISVPETGDSNHFALWTILVFISIAGIGAVTVTKKRESN